MHTRYGSSEFLWQYSSLSPFLSECSGIATGGSTQSCFGESTQFFSQRSSRTLPAFLREWLVPWDIGSFSKVYSAAASQATITSLSKSQCMSSCQPLAPSWQLAWV